MATQAAETLHTCEDNNSISSELRAHATSTYKKQIPVPRRSESRPKLESITLPAFGPDLDLIQHHQSTAAVRIDGNREHKLIDRVRFLPLVY